MRPSRASSAAASPVRSRKIFWNAGGAAILRYWSSNSPVSTIARYASLPAGTLKSPHTRVAVVSGVCLSSAHFCRRSNCG